MNCVMREIEIRSVHGHQSTNFSGIYFEPTNRNEMPQITVTVCDMDTDRVIFDEVL